MSLNYNLDIPNAPNNPSNDQPKMQTNINSINSWTAVDHVKFEDAPAGTHLQVTFSSKNVAGAQLDPQSVLYTNNVAMGSNNTASASTVAELYFRNQNSILPISMIKAFGCFDNVGGSLNAWNLVLNAHPSTGNFTFDMPVGACTGTSYAILCTPQAAFAPPNAQARSQVGVAYSITSDTQFNIQFGIANDNLYDPNQFSILVLQL